MLFITEAGKAKLKKFNALDCLLQSHVAGHRICVDRHKCSIIDSIMLCLSFMVASGNCHDCVVSMNLCIFWHNQTVPFSEETDTWGENCENL